MTCPHSYYAHPEILLFCTIFSKFSTVDEQDESLEKMLQFKERQMKSKAKKIRTFKKPDEKEFNLKARNPLDMIHWEVIKKSKLTPSPALRDISPNELKEWVKNKCPKVRKKIINVLSHSQYCEQSVNMVSKAVSKVSNPITGPYGILLKLPNFQKCHILGDGGEEIFLIEILIFLLLESPENFSKPYGNNFF